MNNLLLTTDDVAKLLGVCKKTVQNYIKEGKLKCYKINKKTTRFSKKHIAEFLKKVEKN